MDDEQEVRAVLRSITAAWDANDADAFAAHYTPDATVVLPGGIFHRDAGEIRAWMAAGFDGPLKGTRGVDEPELVRVGGDGAVVISRTGFLLPGETALPAARERRATWTLRRTPAGWRVAAYANVATAN
ncbi:hypothetical protein GCM10020358_83610 [Amorphoplanes nipponensis]|uniref:DUF4440 domain-containing protein n=1 Tax=Actinoplanes nipponensis TaxID=135950 RepID=A0A919MMY3_9ACTN|nr:SgcJ/EcaC family oxidoreductase [Actinoplanes nipponensis]GIE47898.1 hypothetical protein Ani05nite_14320 [Actinoplanes nipponensis]